MGLLGAAPSAGHIHEVASIRTMFAKVRMCYRESTSIGVQRVAMNGHSMPGLPRCSSDVH